MGTTSRQDREFIKSLISQTLLEDAIYWIANNMDPEDVFSSESLERWADEHDYILKQEH